ncbi:hypothetical protein DFH06DRAFT_1119246 [Mycena polygramma]|nr:hypothetical protein DFH06DRAFT_1119246 [Mycena polygramma]
MSESDWVELATNLPASRGHDMLSPAHAHSASHEHRVQTEFVQDPSRGSRLAGSNFNDGNGKEMTGIMTLLTAALILVSSTIVSASCGLGTSVHPREENDLARVSNFSYSGTTQITNPPRSASEGTTFVWSISLKGDSMPVGRQILASLRDNSKRTQMSCSLNIVLYMKVGNKREFVTVTAVTGHSASVTPSRSGSVPSPPGNTHHALSIRVLWLHFTFISVTRGSRQWFLYRAKRERERCKYNPSTLGLSVLARKMFSYERVIVDVPKKRAFNQYSAGPSRFTTHRPEITPGPGWLQELFKQLALDSPLRADRTRLHPWTPRFLLPVHCRTLRIAHHALA